MRAVVNPMLFILHVGMCMSVWACNNNEQTVMNVKEQGEGLWEGLEREEEGGMI